MADPTQSKSSFVSRALPGLIAFLFVSDCFDELLKRRFEVGFVVDEQSILTEKACVQWARLETAAIAAEE